jgi:hypothetical protein
MAMAQAKWEWVWVHWFAAGCVITWYIMQGRNEPIATAVPSLCAAITEFARDAEGRQTLASIKSKNHVVQAAFDTCWQLAPKHAAGLPNYLP